MSNKFQRNIDAQVPDDSETPEKDCPNCNGEGCESCLFTGSVPMTNKEIEEAQRDAIERKL
jgi:hypothetical protein